MSKSKQKGFRARASRAWDKTFGSSTPAQSPTEFVSHLSAVGPASLPPPTQTLTPPVSNMQMAPSVPANIQLSVPKPSGDLAWNGFRTALGALHKSSTIFPPLQSAIGSLMSCVDMFEDSTKIRNEYEGLMLELKILSESLDRHFQASKSAPMSEFIVKIAQSVQEEVRRITSKQDQNLGNRLLRAEDGAVVVDADLSMWSIATEHLVNTRLENMKPAKLATFDSSLSTEINRRTCTKDTRTAILTGLNEWSTDPNAPNVYWMNGMAGTGKTTIACTFADMLKRRKLLAASFFCTRMTAECQDVNRIVPTIAYQLARYSTPFQSALCRVLGNDPDIAMRTISAQFERLIKEPLVEVKAAIPEGLVVVIDALDECTAKKGVGLILGMLFQLALDLPLKFFVTSRPESSIRNKIESQPLGSRFIFVLHEVGRSEVRADVELYLQEELATVSEPNLRRLVELSGNLFIYAATVVRYLQSGNSQSRLETMLSVKSSSNRKHAEIDELYAAILSAVFDNNLFEEEERESMRLVLWTTVCACEPMSIKTLAMMAGTNEEQKTLEAVEPLQSVLYVSEGDRLVSTLHASFPDFMCNQTRSSRFFCDEKQHNMLLTRNCFKVMKEGLRFNVCGLESSFVPDHEVPNLAECVDKFITPTLSYSCRSWADHLQKGSASEDMLSALQDFVYKRLLFWMEVMNLKRCMGLAIRAIVAAKLWVVAFDPSSDLVVSLEDTRNFMTTFATNPISQSTPHLYISALPFSRRSSNIYRHYWKRTRGLIKLEGALVERGRRQTLASWKVDSSIYSLTYSPDGSLLAIGCGDGSVVIKDAHDGSVIGTPLQDHAGPVASVSFSLDGTRIASGSNDCTICVRNIHDNTAAMAPLGNHAKPIVLVSFSPKGTSIFATSSDGSIIAWNMQNNYVVRIPLVSHPSVAKAMAFSSDCTLIASGFESGGIGVWKCKDGSRAEINFEGHAKPVLSIAFSPDNTRIISGSQDCTIRIWNTRNGTLVGVPLVGHKSWVQSVAFSSDSTRIVSGSDDGKIPLWNAEDCAIIGSPFKSTSSLHSSVLFSPDNTRITAGFEDGTICVWNVQDISPNTDSLQGHTDFVKSVAFSPDGIHIVSGSDDCTVCIWNARDGSSFRTPLQRHVACVTSVAFSPDGKHLASGSQDLTIRVCNMQGGALASSPFLRHSSPITSVVFSPDGTRLASSSEDLTVCIWDVHEGTLVCEPPLHTKKAWSVAFSPDGTLIASGSGSTISFWSVTNGALLLSFHTNASRVRSVAFSPDGSCLVSESQNCAIQLWDVQDGSPVGTSFGGYSRGVSSIAFSADGRHIVSGSLDTTVRVWSVHNSALACPPLHGHTGGVTSVAFSPDGTRVVSGSWDYTVRIWRLNNGTTINASPSSYMELRRSLKLIPATQYSPNHNICPSGTGSNSPIIDSWIPDEDGWVRDKDSQLIVWVPQDLARVLPAQHDTWVVGSDGGVHVRYDGLLLGQDWRHCYALE